MSEYDTRDTTAQLSPRDRAMTGIDSPAETGAGSRLSVLRDKVVRTIKGEPDPLPPGLQHFYDVNAATETGEIGNPFVARMVKVYAEHGTKVHEKELAGLSGLHPEDVAVLHPVLKSVADVFTGKASPSIHPEKTRSHGGKKPRQETVAFSAD